MHVVLFCLCFLAFSFLYCTVISIIRKGLAFRLPGGVVSYPSMLCPRGRAFRGCPTSGSSTFLLMFFFGLVFFVFFFQSPCKRLKNLASLCAPWVYHRGRVQLGRCSPRSCSPVPSPEAVSKLAVKASVRDLRFRNPVCFRAATFTISSRGGRKYLQVKRNVLKSCLTSGTVLMLTPFSPHIRATSRASFTIVPFHLVHFSLTANNVRSSRILSPPLFRSASPMVSSPCGERWENAHLRIWLCH